MNPLFPIRRLVQGDGFLQGFSASQEELLQELEGRSIAIVGNARSLSQQQHGSRIDGCDVVVRMHAAPLTSLESHGSRTTWLALGMPVAQSILEARNPERVLWMAYKRKRVRERIARARGFYLHPRTDWQNLAATLGAPPTTGAMLIEFAARSAAGEIHLFGFDFFASLSLSGRRTAAQVPHDFAAEKAFVQALVDRDPRVVLHQ